MKKKRTGLQRAGTVMLAIWLCIAMMPLGAFAEDGLPAAESDVQLEMQEGESLDLTGLDEQAAEEAATEEPVISTENIETVSEEQ
jgi:hypothetical protein